MQKTASNVASDPETMLVIKRVFDAPAEHVFDAWMDPAQIGKWIGPRTINAEVLELEPRTGGRYRIFMRGPDGTGPTVGGVYREVSRPERLVFSWTWETGHPMGAAGDETLVSLSFRNVGGKTEMTLRHEFFTSKESRDSHNQGWGSSFDKLAETLG